MDNFRYTITKKQFDEATTIKARKAIFAKLLTEEASPLGYKLLDEIKSSLRETDILHKQHNMMTNLRNELQRNIFKAMYNQEEVDMVFKNIILEMHGASVDEAIAICNKTPNLEIRLYIRSDHKVLPSIVNTYSNRARVELVMNRDKINNYNNSTLYRQLTKDLPSYETLIAPLVGLIHSLEPFKTHNIGSSTST